MTYAKLTYSGLRGWGVCKFDMGNVCEFFCEKKVCHG